MNKLAKTIHAGRRKRMAGKTHAQIVNALILRFEECLEKKLAESYYPTVGFASRLLLSMDRRGRIVTIQLEVVEFGGLEAGHIEYKLKLI